MIRRIRTVAVALSGGVDSSVACLILKKKGYNVQAVYMQNWNTYEEQGTCTGEQDYLDACKAADIIGVPLRKVSFEKEYWNYVFVEMIKSFENGETPNPDILCNQHIKFGFLLNYALQNMGADWLATGHYARLIYQRDGVKLLKGVDTSKDQTYFLSLVHQNSLQKAMFPVGELLKSQVREIATENFLGELARKRESMGICFVGKRSFKEFLNEYIEPRPGDVIDITTKKPFSKHEGCHMFTEGQRLRLPGQSAPYYVCLKDAKANIIYIAADRDHPTLNIDQFTCVSDHWISEQHCNRLYGKGTLTCDCRIRHQTDVLRCTVRLNESNNLTNCDNPIKSDNFTGCNDPAIYGNLTVTLHTPPPAVIAPGQYTVFYDGEECIGGAMIAQRDVESLLNCAITS